MSPPSKPYRVWKTEDLSQLIQEPKAKENARLDFKKDCNLLRKEKCAKEKAKMDILKDVSAMANGVGGALLIGVEEKRGPDTPPVAEEIPGIPTEEVERLKTAIKSAVDTHLDIRPAPLHFKEIPTPEDNKRSVLIVEVPQNIHSLSMVTYDQANQFWVRRGTDNKPMRTDEVQYAFERLMKIRDSALEELKEIRRTIFAPHTGNSIIWFAGIPIQRIRDHVPVDVERMKNILRRSSYFDAYPTRQIGNTYPLRPSHRHPMILYARLQPSLHGISIRKSAKTEAELEIRRDGTVLFATVARDAERKRDSVPLEEVYETWCGGLYLLKDIQDHFSVSRLAVVHAGLAGCSNLPLTLREYNGGGWRITGNDVEMDKPFTIDENWEPETVFARWAETLSNSVGEERTIVCDPWVNIPT